MVAEISLQTLHFHAGRSPGAASENVDVGAVTVFVGPNNSGKSIALHDVWQWANQGVDPPRPWPGGVVLSAVDAAFPENDVELDEFLRPWTLPSVDGHLRRLRGMSLAQQALPGLSSGTRTVRRYDGRGNFPEYCRNAVLPVLATHLDGRSRFDLATSRQMSTLREAPGNHLMALLLDQQLYDRANKEIVDVFGHQLVIDTSQPPGLELALSTQSPPHGFWPERTFDPDVVAYQTSASRLLEFSDGVQIYTGLIAAIESWPQVVLLIDEPEAFLHPTLARRLGRRLARSARERRANLLAATHSADFLLGCVDEVPATTIVRLTYDAGVATARPLGGASVEKLVRDPLLRSADALSALFARGAVVCEADADRAFYEEINRRLDAEVGRNGASDTTFLNAQNWQTVPKIVGPLRRLGVAAAAVVDLDALTQRDKWGEYFEAATTDAQERARLHRLRARAGDLLRAAGTLGTGTTLACKESGLDSVTDVNLPP